jgi:hypothetical protein
MTNINVELKGPNGPRIVETLTPAVVAAAKRGLAVAYGADEYHCAVVATAGAVAIGLIDEDAVSAQLPVGVVVSGQAVGQIGATVTPGQLLTPNASGQLIPAATGNRIIARAMSGNPNAGDFIAVLVVPGSPVAP